MSLARIISLATLAALAWCLPATAQAVGLFQCVDPAGRQVCVLDTGSMTNFSPSSLCNRSCPACAGRCDGARYYPSQSGHWEKSWQVAPGIGDNNILTPGPDVRQDAQTIVREGLAAPQTPPPPPPGTYYPVAPPTPDQPLPPGYYYYVPPSSGTPIN
ncbi:hypothetical protein [Solidesulfovibrio sp.]|jgi:hypothetical protein|uniref:hypothetical protein n=1 Tax=Solidesulfovibrio sp. TaxID=2910990 RepID=UPI002B1F4BD9|nr:hypothetical protein [Solidesulfovibrio sp.]MEA4856558.1 hypothetical protein [Solidesulfovibrio sp.]